jgi:hypothetical protein
MDRSEWTRIADDLRRTTGRELGLTFDLREWDPTYVSLDGVAQGGFGPGLEEVGSEEWLAELADQLQDTALDEEIWGGWPICPDHSHQLNPRVVDGIASWVCPRGPTIARIGALGG